MINLTDYCWHSGSGETISVEEILQDIKESKLRNSLIELHVGTDSDPNGKKFANATGIALRFPGSGCRYYWTRTYLDPIKNKNLAVRLNAEVTQTIFIADALRKALAGSFEIVVHIDCSPNIKHRSGIYTKQLKSYAIGMGFTVKVKPNSWAASCIADKHAKKIYL